VADFRPKKGSDAARLDKQRPRPVVSAGVQVKAIRDIAEGRDPLGDGTTLWSRLIGITQALERLPVQLVSVLDFRAFNFGPIAARGGATLTRRRDQTGPVGGGSVLRDPQRTRRSRRRDARRTHRQPHHQHGYRRLHRKSDHQRGTRMRTHS
jgi:hypothetical protein